MSGVAGQITGMGLVALEDKDERKMSFLFGVDPSTYPGLFPDTFLVEGRYLAPGEEGLVVSRGWLKSAEKELKAPVKLGDKLTINGFGQAGFKIREVTIVGVVDFSAETEGMDMIAWANADTVRILSGVDVSAEDVVLSSEQTALLDAASEEDIFGARRARSRRPRRRPRPARRCPPRSAPPRRRGRVVALPAGSAEGFPPGRRVHRRDERLARRAGDRGRAREDGRRPRVPSRRASTSCESSSTSPCSSSPSSR